jgi:hypothetical protein
MHDLTGEKYQDMFVASYCARPDKKEVWEEQARFLLSSLMLEHFVRMMIYPLLNI